jgi:hypothetical protein
VKRVISADVLPQWSDRDARTITSREVIELLGQDRRPWLAGDGESHRQYLEPDVHVRHSPGNCSRFAGQARATVEIHLRQVHWDSTCMATTFHDWNLEQSWLLLPASVTDLFPITAPTSFLYALHDRLRVRRGCDHGPERKRLRRSFPGPLRNGLHHVPRVHTIRAMIQDSRALRRVKNGRIRGRPS